MISLKNLIKKAIHSSGYEIKPRLQVDHPADSQDAEDKDAPPELTTFDLETVAVAAPYTMTSRQRLYSLIKAVRYISRHQIAGSIVECGVWKGGSMLAAARTLLDVKDNNRELFLYDTYEGMPPPSKEDMDAQGNDAQQLLNTTPRDGVIWAIAQLDLVKTTIALSGYESAKIHYVKGKVEETIPRTAPEKIALLRLDTDWYESTAHELKHLFPLLVQGGVLIIDDYGHWQGARKAVDEYFDKNPSKVLLNVIDYTGRIAVKVV